MQLVWGGRGEGDCITSSGRGSFGPSGIMLTIVLYIQEWHLNSICETRRPRNPDFPLFVFGEISDKTFAVTGEFFKLLRRHQQQRKKKYIYTSIRRHNSCTYITAADNVSVCAYNETIS